MENQARNPLSGYFRQAAIYIKLPSEGRYWGKGALDLPPTGEIAVYPMSTKDEIVLRTPDALLNGQGIVDVIHSCCPEIKNAWEMPGIDVDAVLVGIRIATYGNSMTFSSKCPHCGEENEHDVDLSQILSSIDSPNFSDLISYKDLKIKLKPQFYFNVNKANMITFEEQRLIGILNNASIEPEDKAKQLTESMTRLVEIGLDAVAHSTDYIELPNSDRVQDVEFIKEFYEKAESALITKIQEKIAEFAKQNKVKPLKLGCYECHKQYDMDLTFDYANFFGKGF